LATFADALGQRQIQTIRAQHERARKLSGPQKPLACAVSSHSYLVRLMNKTQLVQQIIVALSESLAVLENAARASHAEATHESSKAESKYDTRGLEAAYLAGGQARQAKEIMDSIKVYGSLGLKKFGADEPIDVTALVELDADGMRSIYFVGPRNGGLEIKLGRKEVTVITPQSPLGQSIMGKKAGRRWTIQRGASSAKYHIISVD
jgi:hypothetical protein